MSRAAALGAALAACLAPGLCRGDDGPLSLADIPAYAAALRGTSARDGPPVAATFRDLWDHPDRLAGRPVRVEGRVVRRFRQPAFGAFPPLDEVWIVSPAGDPLCLVFPARPSGAAIAKAAPVSFAGTFLRLIRYEGGDSPRLAPVIVGPRPPEPASPGPAPAPFPRLRDSRLEWALGLGVAAVAALVLGLQHARKPPRRPAGPDPEFLPGGIPGQDAGPAR